ncbi:hypothetical protein BH11MYX2_BH11MYX2_06670 [soil metagenome]
MLAACGSERTPELPSSGSSAPVLHDGAVVAAADAVASIDAGSPDAPRPEHVVYDLVDNRHAAHRTVDGDLVLDASDIGFARYTRVGTAHWKLGQTVDGKRAAAPDKIAGIEVPLTVEQARTSNQLAMEIYAAADVAVSLKVNGGKASKDARVQLSKGWSIVTLAIAPTRLVVGENELALEWKRTAKAPKDETTVAIDWIRIGQKRALVPSGPARNATDGSAASDALSVDLTDPRGAALFDPRLHAILLNKDAMLTYFVTVPDGANLVAEVEAPCTVEVRARPSADAFAGGILDAQRSRVDLTQMAGRVVALTLTTHDCARAKITRPRLTLHGAERARLPNAPAPKYVVVWEMDGLRADSLPVVTPGARISTPTFDELAKTSTVFRQVYAPGAQMLLPGPTPVPDFAAIATSMRDAAYVSAAVTGTGPQLVDEALKQLETLRAKPTYLFLAATHTMVCPSAASAEDVQKLRGLYDEAIVAQDDQLGRFVKQLRTWGIWDETLLVVVANHGEELVEAGRCGFGASLRDAVVHVPLIIHDPSRFPGGAIVEEGADASDVFPTILDAVGKADLIGHAVHGASLAPLAQGVGKGWPRASYAANGAGVAMRVGRWKITVATGVIAIADLVGDPAETTELSASAPVERRMLTDNLGVYLALRPWNAAWGVVTQVTPAGADALDAAASP